MLLKTLTLPAILIATLGLAMPEKAEASPFGNSMSQATANAYGGLRIRVGGGVRVPIRGRHYRPSHTVVRRGGYWTTVYETRLERVWHPPEFIGHDSHGHPVYSKGHYDTVEVRVPVRRWVPYTTVHRRRGYRTGPVGHISIGGSVRIR